MTEFVLSLFFLVFVLLMLGSISIWGNVIVRMRAGIPIHLPAMPGSGADSTPRPSWGALLPPLLFTLPWIGLSLLGLLERERAIARKDVYNNLAVSAFGLCVLGSVTAVSLHTSRTPPAALGFTRTDWRAQLTAGALGFVACVAPVWLVLVATLPFRSLEVMHPLLRFLLDSPHPADWMAVWIAAAVVAPLLEELVFRVLLQSALERLLGWPAALWMVAGLFAIVHGFPDALPILPLAVILGYVFHKTRSYLAVVTLHALFNAYNMIQLVLGQYLEQLQP